MRAVIFIHVLYLLLMKTFTVKAAKCESKVELRAVLLSCPVKDSGCDDDDPLSQAMKSEEVQILQTDPCNCERIKEVKSREFPSAVKDCKRKLIITLKIKNSGKIPCDDEYIVVDHVFDPLTGGRGRLLSPVVIKLRQEQMVQLYGLQFQRAVNSDPFEEQKPADNGCGIDPKNPTCGIAMYNGKPIPFSEGFCCSLDPHVNAKRQLSPLSLQGEDIPYRGSRLFYQGNPSVSDDNNANLIYNPELVTLKSGNSKEPTSTKESETNEIADSVFTDKIPNFLLEGDRKIVCDKGDFMRELCLLRDDNKATAKTDLRKNLGADFIKVDNEETERNWLLPFHDDLELTTVSINADSLKHPNSKLEKNAVELHNFIKTLDMEVPSSFDPLGTKAIRGKRENAEDNQKLSLEEKLNRFATSRSWTLGRRKRLMEISHNRFRKFDEHPPVLETPNPELGNMIPPPPRYFFSHDRAIIDPLETLVPLGNSTCQLKQIFCDLPSKETDFAKGKVQNCGRLKGKIEVNPSFYALTKNEEKMPKKLVVETGRMEKGERKLKKKGEEVGRIEGEASEHFGRELNKDQTSKFYGKGFKQLLYKTDREKFKLKHLFSARNKEKDKTELSKVKVGESGQKFAPGINRDKNALDEKSLKVTEIPVKEKDSQEHATEGKVWEINPDQENQKNEEPGVKGSTGTDLAKKLDKQSQSLPQNPDTSLGDVDFNLKIVRNKGPDNYHRKYYSIYSEMGEKPKLEYTVDGQPAKLEYTVNGHPATLEYTVNGPPAKLESTVNGHPAKLEYTVNGPPAKLESTVNGHPAKLEYTVNGPPAKLEYTVNGHPAKLEYTVNGPPAKLEYTVNGHPAKLEYTVNGPPAKLEYTVNGHPAKLEYTVNGPPAKLEYTVNGHPDVGEAQNSHPNRVAALGPPGTSKMNPFLPYMLQQKLLYDRQRKFTESDGIRGGKLSQKRVNYQKEMRKGSLDSKDDNAYRYKKPFYGHFSPVDDYPDENSVPIKWSDELRDTSPREKRSAEGVPLKDENLDCESERKKRSAAYAFQPAKGFFESEFDSPREKGPFIHGLETCEKRRSCPRVKPENFSDTLQPPTVEKRKTKLPSDKERLIQSYLNAPKYVLEEVENAVKGKREANVAINMNNMNNKKHKLTQEGPSFECADPQDTMHCMRYGDLWYSLYTIKKPMISQIVGIQLFDKHTSGDVTEWRDLTKGKMIRIGTFITKAEDELPSISVTYSGERTGPYKNTIDPDNYFLLIPSHLSEVSKSNFYPQLDGGPSEYMLVPSSEVSSGGECNRIGTSFEAFVRRPDRCAQPQGSCLKRQPVDLWREDMEARIRGKRGRYFVENFGTVPNSPIKSYTNLTGEFLALEYYGEYTSTIEIEVKADANAIIRRVSIAQIPLVYIDSTYPKKTRIILSILNTGLTSSNFRPRLGDCPPDLDVAWCPLEGPLIAIPPHQRHDFKLDLSGALPLKEIILTVEVLSQVNKVVASRKVVIKREHRCLCAFHCKCNCVGASKDGRTCHKLSLEDYRRAGYVGTYPFRGGAAGYYGGPGTLWACIHLILVTMSAILFFFGFLKGILGLFIRRLGIAGVRVITGPRRLSCYYESELKGCTVLCDECGFPIHPTTCRPVQIVPLCIEMVLNFLFFFLYPLRGVWFWCLSSSCCSLNSDCDSCCRREEAELDRKSSRPLLSKDPDPTYVHYNLTAVNPKKSRQEYLPYPAYRGDDDPLEEDDTEFVLQEMKRYRKK